MSLKFASALYCSHAFDLLSLIVCSAENTLLIIDHKKNMDRIILITIRSIFFNLLIFYKLFLFQQTLFLFST